MMSWWSCARLCGSGCHDAIVICSVTRRHPVITWSKFFSYSLTLCLCLPVMEMRTRKREVLPSGMQSKERREEDRGNREKVKGRRREEIRDDSITPPAGKAKKSIIKRCEKGVIAS